MPASGTITLNEGRRGDHADGRNILTCCRLAAIIIFGEANSALDLIATQARHMRLDIAAGTAVGRNRPTTGGPADRDWRAATDLRVQPAGYGGSLNGTKIASQADYAAMFGPTTGDKLAGGHTDLIIEVERPDDLHARLNLAAAKHSRWNGQAQTTRARRAPLIR
jgi:hypothetical protein